MAIPLQGMNACSETVGRCMKRDPGLSASDRIEKE
jgi:hypothetical protein